MRLDTRLITRLGLPDDWILQDSRSRQKREAGIDPASIAAAIRAAVDADAKPAPRVLPAEASPSAAT
jgi:hypothetical protein